MGKLTPELRKVLKLQYPEDIAIEVRGEIVHFKDTEENWERLAKGSGLKLFKEKRGNRNWVLYNPKNFEVISPGFGEHLKCISEENLEMPINCSSCYDMFREVEFKTEDAFKNFDTSNITSMSSMFQYCVFPEDFSLGNKFDTSNVIDMESMFYHCTFSNNFSLGDKFDTSNVKHMGHMFSHCTCSNNFSLGDKFDTSNVIDMICMFENCKFTNDFSLGDKFDTSNVENMSGMFEYCIFQNDFSLGDKFNTSNVKYMSSMFWKSMLPEGKTEKDFNDDYKQIVEWLKSRKPKSSNKTSNTNFFK